MNIFKKLFSKKKTKENITPDNAYQNSFINDNYDFSKADQTVKLSDIETYDEVTQPLNHQEAVDENTVPLNNFEFEDFGATVLLNSDISDHSDDTVLLNNSIEEKASEEQQHISVETMLNKIYLINPLSGGKININKQIFTIGSGNDVDYIIYKSSVSSNHASIFIKDTNEFYIVDNSSTNGTQVEGVSIEPMKMVTIENGDLITFGEELYQFYIEE